MENNTEVTQEQKLKDLVVELSFEKSNLIANNKDLFAEAKQISEALSTICRELVGEQEQVSVPHVLDRIRELKGLEEPVEDEVVEAEFDPV